MAQAVAAGRGEGDPRRRGAGPVGPHVPGPAQHAAQIDQRAQSGAGRLASQQPAQQEVSRQALQHGGDGADRDGGEPLQQGEQGGGQQDDPNEDQHLAPAGVVHDPFQEWCEQIEPHQQIDEPDVVITATVQQAPQIFQKGEGAVGAPAIRQGIDQVPQDQGDHQAGEAAAVEGSHLKGAGVPQDQEAAEHKKEGDAGAAEGVQQQAEVPGGRP